MKPAEGRRATCRAKRSSNTCSTAPGPVVYPSSGSPEVRIPAVSHGWWLGWCTSAASTSGLPAAKDSVLDGRQVVAKDCAHWASGQRLLINRSVQAAVFENSGSTILGEGLAYDKCEVGVVTVTVISGTKALKRTTTSWMHEQTYKVARTQVDVILPTGTAVLNADDPQVVEFARAVRRPL
jgi:hypothetical protein